MARVRLKLEIQNWTRQILKLLRRVASSGMGQLPSNFRSTEFLSHCFWRWSSKTSVDS